MRQPVHELFGQAPATHQDVAAWLVSVARMDPGSPRAAWYVKAYGVAEKIAAAKLRSDFEQATQTREQPMHWWLRFK